MTAEPSEDTLLLQINSIFDKFDRQTEKLDTITAKANGIIKNVRNVVNSDFFSKPQSLWDAIDKLSEVVGNLEHTVMEIELIRQKIRQPFDMLELQRDEKAQKELEGRHTPVVVQTAAQPVQSSPGVWGYLAERRRMGVLEKLTRNDGKPQITTTMKPADILDYCRNIPLECNRLVDYYQASLDHLHFFSDEDTASFLYSEIRAYVAKLCIIIKSFTKAIVEYRKELVGHRQVKYAEAITMLKQAEFYASQRAGGSPFFPDGMAGELKRRMNRDE